ncbi:MAG TPA: hypothetical protein VHR86_08020, partial [Armatimonadota bacterium]|nr:hypothetical protein [Armatimonadota bacterium]
ASEPETRALLALIARYQPRKVISIHQPFRYLDWTGQRGRWLAVAMQRYNRYRMVDGNKHVLPGCLGGYCGLSLGIAMVTLELPSGSADAAWWRNRSALLGAIRYRLPATAANDAPMPAAQKDQESRLVLPRDARRPI